jgi:hypothetical protein
MCPSVKTSLPFRLASPMGLGVMVLTVIPSTQPGSSTSIAFSSSRRASIVKRASKYKPPRTRLGA